MFLSEHQSKSLLARHGVPIPPGGTAATAGEAAARARKIAADRYAVKAQISAGGRGLAGGIGFADTPEGVGREAARILGRTLVTNQTGPRGETVGTVYVEQAVEMAASLYLAIVIDQGTALPTLLGSLEGGVEFEEKAAARPEILERLTLKPDCSADPGEIRDFFRKLDLTGDGLRNAENLVTACIGAFRDNDVSLMEINPLAVLPDKAVTAVDAKVVLDANAMFRHPEFEELSNEILEDPSERIARENDINFVAMDGDVGVVVNGAGLGLATNDMLVDAGGRPANFMDIRTTARSFQIARGVSLLLDNPAVKVILLNVHGGGMTVCDTVVEGLAFAYSRSNRKPPIIARLAGQNAPWAQSILKDRRLPHELAATMSEAVARAVDVARGKGR